jgi:hypothetical protein
MAASQFELVAIPAAMAAIDGVPAIRLTSEAREEIVLRALLNSSARRFAEDPDSIFEQAPRQAYRPIRS